MSHPYNFSEIAAKLNKINSLPEEERKVREFCIDSSVIPYSDFNSCLAKEMFQISSQITPSKERPILSTFELCLKELDEYPTNLQKPKKIHAREMSRLNMTAMTNSTSALIESTTAAKLVDATAGEIYSEFKKFRAQLITLNTELAHNDTFAKEHASKLKELGTFSKQLEKLLSSKDLGEKAFSAAEDETIGAVAANLEHLKNIRDHQHIYRLYDQDHSAADIGGRLKSVTEILEYTLQNQNCN